MAKSLILYAVNPQPPSSQSHRSALKAEEETVRSRHQAEAGEQTG